MADLYREGVYINLSRAFQSNAAVIAVLCVAAITIGLRFTARSVQRARLGADDWTIIVAFLFTAAVAALSITGFAYGAGRNWYEFDPDLLPDSMGAMGLLFFVDCYMHAAAATVTKVSILLFYQRVFGTNRVSFRFCLAIAYFLVIAYFVVECFVLGFSCTPLSFGWHTKGKTGYCVHLFAFHFIISLANMTSDIYILLIPVPQILVLQMSRKKKSAVLGILLLGAFVCVSSMVRVYYTYILTGNDDYCITYAFMFLWTAIEPAAAIISACLPHLAPLGRVVRSKVSSYAGSSKASGSSGGRQSSSPSSSGSQRNAKANSPPTYGSSRFHFGEQDRSLKLVKSEDEMALTNSVTGNASTHHRYGDSGSSQQDIEKAMASIVVQSSFAREASRI